MIDGFEAPTGPGVSLADRNELWRRIGVAFPVEQRLAPVVGPS
jgi:hypothetical protein